jgi:GMP synthase (glutamine-hydrolysing)
MHHAEHRPALILRTGDTIPELAPTYGEFAGWITRASGDAWGGPWAEHDARRAVPLPAPSAFAAVVITGSASSVTERAAWMLRTEAWLREAAALGTPLFGICFGHQLLGQAFGGEVRRNPRGREIGTVELTVHDDDPLFDGLPRRFQVNATHVDTVAVLPARARRLGSTSLEPHAALAVGDHVRGVQFHPEIDGALMRGYVGARRAAMSAERLDPDAVAAGCADTPLAERILGNFFRHIVHRRLAKAG